jgi:hypothetical protein
MNWGKHRTDSHDDEKMALLLDKHGAEGYGAYWLIWEIVGSQLKEANTKVTYPEGFWRKKLRLSERKMKMFFKFFSENQLFFVEVSGQMITIDCPKLLKYRDEYSSRRAKKQESIGTMSGLRGEEEEKKRREEEETPPPPCVRGRVDESPPKETPETFSEPPYEAIQGEMTHAESAALLAKIRPIFEEIWPEAPKTTVFSDRMITNVVDWAGRLPEFRHIDAWRGSIARARASPFLRGEVPGKDGRPFARITLDWFLRPGNQANIVNGLYDERRPKKPEPVDLKNFNPVRKF